MAGAGLINMQPYTWTPTARLAVEANNTAMQAAAHMDKNRNAGQKKKGIGGSLGGLAGTAIGAVVGGAPGAMIGGALGGLAGGAIGGDTQSSLGGAAEGLGMGMAMASTGGADKLQKGVADFFKNSGMETAADAAGTALKGAGADGNWSHSFTSDTASGAGNNNLMSKITTNALGLTPNSGMQFRGMSPGSMTLPMFGGAR